MKKEIVIVTGSMKRGGAERVISIIANELVNRGWKIHIITLLYKEVGYKLNSEIDVIDISNERRNQIIDTPRLILLTRYLIKKIKPDFVISFMLTINIVTWIATRGLNVKFIPSERNDPNNGRGILKHWLSCLAYANSYKTVFQTERARHFYSKKIQEKGMVIPNPVNVEKYCDPERKQKIVSVGRLESQKNHRLLIEAFSEVIKKHKNYSLHIYGDGSLRNKTKKLVEYLGLEENVFLHGNVEHVHEQIADASIFVLSSNYEGMSNALLEAMTMGLACVSTNCSGVLELINNGENGVIVPVGDKQSMTEAINYLIENSEERVKMGIKANESVKKYCVCNIVDRWEFVFKDN